MIDREIQNWLNENAFEYGIENGKTFSKIYDEDLIKFITKLMENKDGEM